MRHFEESSLSSVLHQRLLFASGDIILPVAGIFRTGFVLQEEQNMTV